MHKPAITSVSIQETIAARWSGRAYDATKKVSQEQIIALLEAARWAPSAFNGQPWRFYVGQRGDEVFTQILDSLAHYSV